MKVILLVLLFGVAIVSSKKTKPKDKCIDKDEYGTKVYDEVPCLGFKGHCSKKCPNEDWTEMKGLCPNQKDKGVECCESLTLPKAKCSSRNGSCIPKENHCAPVLVFKNATDCDRHYKCCIDPDAHSIKIKYNTTVLKEM